MSKIFIYYISEYSGEMHYSPTTYIFVFFMCLFSFSSVRLRKNSTLKKSEDFGELKKGQKLIEKETMETGQVI